MPFSLASCTISGASSPGTVSYTHLYNVDLDTLTHVLDTPGSKMQAKGISSVKSRVANLKEYLPQFKSLDALQAALQELSLIHI